MKKLISLLLVFSLFLSGCSTVKDYASKGIDAAADSAGVSRKISNEVKKAAIPKTKNGMTGMPEPAKILYAQCQKHRHISTAYLLICFRSRV